MDIVAIGMTLAAAGMGAGFLAGLLGIGGGIVTIPVLFVAFAELDIPIEWRMHVSIATSLAIIIVTNISSVRAHHKKGGVDWHIVKDWWWAIALGSIFGGLFAKILATEHLVYLFAGLAGVLALKMMLPLDGVRLGSSLPVGLFRWLSPGLIGFFSAILGIGGGSFSVPYMTLYGVPIHRAVGTASLAGLVISVAGAASYIYSGQTVPDMPDYMLGFVHLPAAGTVAVFAVIFAPIGAAAAHKLPKRALTAIFGLFLLLATIRLLSAV